MKIGIFAASSQSGRAYLADLTHNGHEVYGYCRESSHGKEFVNKIYEQNGLYLRRPASNTNREESELLITMSPKTVGHDLQNLLNTEVIILAEPSTYFVESAKTLKEAGIIDKKIPLILSPSRTFTVPEIWKILGEGYPIIGFSTCIYSCKAPEPGVSFIKRRKRSWIASMEGNIDKSVIEKLRYVFKQCVWSNLPASTSLGNIGMVFHPTTYLLNYDAISEKKAKKQEFSFYMEGIANRPDVGEHLEKIDRIRLELAEKIGIKVYMPGREKDEEEWQVLTAPLYKEENLYLGDIEELRKLRQRTLNKIRDCVVGTQFWLDYTYGVKRIKGEPLYQTIARTPTYQKMSVAQERYINEDMPTGLFPIFVFGKKLGIDVSAIEQIVTLYESYKGDSAKWINIYKQYDIGYVKEYLLGEINAKKNESKNRNLNLFGDNSIY